MKKTLVVIVAGVLLLSACQSASEELAEQIAEQADGVSDVDINTDTGEVKVETEDGSITVGGGDIPDDFPIPTPDGYEVVAVFTADTEASVSLLYPQDRFDELTEFYDGWTESQPWEWSSSTNSYETADGEAVRNTTWFSQEATVAITDCSGGQTTGIDMTCVTLLWNG